LKIPGIAVAEPAAVHKNPSYQVESSQDGYVVRSEMIP